MKLATYAADSDIRYGIVRGEAVVDLVAAGAGRLSGSLKEMLARENGLELVRELEERCETDPAFAEQHSTPLAEVDLLAPIPRPGKVLCLGLNYRDHAAEGGMDVPEEPVVFSKAATSVIGPGATICLPRVSHKVDYEVELAFVIGRTARHVPEGRGLDHVAGYTVLNDVSARDYQLEKAGGQWMLGKSFDTFCPTGPWLVTADQVSDPHDLDLTCTVSGKMLQSSNTRQMVFTVPQIVEYLSRILTLEPGDLVATGTPPGVGFAQKPPRFLRPDDVVECTVQGIGTLSNPVEDEADVHAA